MGNCSNVDGNDDLESGIKEHSYSEQERGSKSKNNAIENAMRQYERHEKRIIKLLLLGAGSSGKSTLFRQIQHIHTNEQKKDSHALSSTQQENLRSLIRYNCISQMVTLLQKSVMLSDPPYNLQQCALDAKQSDDENVDTEQTQKAITLLLDFAKKVNQEYEPHNLQSWEQLTQAMKYLWRLKAVKATFDHRQFFSLLENMDYFWDKLDDVMQETEHAQYLPTLQDTFNARTTTSGILENEYIIQGIPFYIFDVGGQRNERRKWIKLFDLVHAVIFVAALNHYSCVLFEDETCNAMKESIQLFRDLINSKYFNKQYTRFILFLNKKDLFEQRLRDDKIPLTFCFEEYDGPNYGDKTDDEFGSQSEQNEYFESCYDSAIDYIREQYLGQIDRKIAKRVTVAVYVTMATNTDNIEKVFNVVRSGIIQAALRDSGLN
mmetsp:Transcript_39401/g.64459  ORF Transcript_39401/g.64459 Transcript_39401/m.64459 type:complete len:434 (-) Transcript_39401:191-1492(-)|eukprot:CAMPEP_0202713404 /NCGR_PEP_ID=MMETSP1385-20130828/53332_1 /ASSEMBLY_ACC=CAM_ASM_000861 /TAXON_ID=933848 /ORGANISM="Elphidium margaritaceum" /LENGTH=433 /DNA_ID=CAMNT_0049373735 /DNA_START=17 /DNA_END=1318 /DNA_ORIENTATION=-